MEILLKIIHIVASVFLVLVVLLQSGRGGGMGAAFGGASGQIFGGRGAGSFLTRLTTGSAVVFFLTSLTLSMLSSRHRSVLSHAKAPISAPAQTAADETDKPADSADKPADAADKPADAGAAAPAEKPDAPSPAPAH